MTAATVQLLGNQRAQSLFIRDMAPGWVALFGGWGSGKSWAGARKLLVLTAHNGCPSMAVAPTWNDLWRFVVPALKAAAEQWAWPFETLRSDPPMMKVAGTHIFLMTADQPARFAGFEVGAAWLDEAARYPTSEDDPLRDAPTQIRGRLRHPSAKVRQANITTTPEGLYTWVQRDWFDKPLPGHRAYTARTTLNRALAADYVESLKSSISAELVDQYLGGRAVSLSANRAHPTFSRARHVRPCPIDYAKPLHVGCDYNVSPMCWVAAQVHGQEVQFVDEVVLRDFGQVDAAVQAAHDKGWGRAFVHFHPDKSSKARSTTGDSEWTAMTGAARRLGWRLTGNAFGVNPPVDHRINHVSRMLLDATGKSRIAIDPRCKVLIEDLERVKRATNGYDPGPDGRHGHILDAVGYLLWDAAAPVFRGIFVATVR